MQMSRKKELIRDIVEWDVKNWWRAIEFWESKEADSFQGKKVLDIGGRSGGLSLYWALKGADVICSDISEDGFEKAKRLHEKYGVENHIRYEVIDATQIPYENEFDVICFKSVLGGVGYDDNYDRQKQMMRNIYAALKDEGRLYFCENLIASPIHQTARKRYVGWGKRWRYLKLQEICELTEDFSEVNKKTIGFFGVFGRKRWLSETLGEIDGCFDRYIKGEWRYIVTCVCNK